MIARLSGKLISKEQASLILDVGGVGYEVTVSAVTFQKLPPEGGALTLLIHTAVRENDISLFGFLESDEKEIFEKLLTVSGIGPKLAMTILSGIAPHELASSLYREDLVRLTAIPGIGRKTAERMIVDLKDKLVGFAASSPSSRPSRNRRPKIYEDLLSALTNLGYNRGEAEKTVAQLELPEETPIESALKEALKLLA